MAEKIYYKIKGLNFNKFLSLLKNENIEIFEFQKLDYNLFCLAINSYNKKTFLKICKKMNYTLCQNLKNSNKLKTKIAFFMGIIFISFILLFSSNLVFKVKILGLENLTEREVLSVLNTNGFSTGKQKNSYNLNDLEIVLKSNLEKVSFVSCVIVGSTLVINIHEKIDNGTQNLNFATIFAPYDLILESVELKSGTLVANVGQTVKKGEAIVEPYIYYKDGTKLNVEANAKITAYVELASTLTYLETHIEKVRTGNKATNTHFSLCGINLGESGKEPNFENYEIETFDNYPFKNFILPFKKTIVTYYELTEKKVYIPFNSAMQNLIEKNKNLLYNNIIKETKEAKNIEYFSTINTENDVYFLTTYLKATITF